MSVISAQEQKLPTASIEVRARRSFAWLLPLFAFALAIYLGASAWMRRGPLIEIRVPAGHGIRVGDDLRYRGVSVGMVECVDLADDLTEVMLGVRLEPAAGGLARAGSRFWIVRPHLALDGVQGLETVIGARYLGVLPGPLDSARQSEFIALAEPPVAGMGEEGVLEVVIEAGERHGLSPGAPIHYRGIEIGSVFSVGLASDARAVEVRAGIRAPFAELVREDSRFWQQGGVDFSLGLRGLRFEFESLRTLFVGGIALSTPTRPGARVRTGHRFYLHAEPEESWLTWQPPLALGRELLPAGARVPELVRAQHVFEQGVLGIDRSRAGWLLSLADGWVGPADLLTHEEGARAKTEGLELLGQRLALDGEPLWQARGLALRRLDLVPPEGGALAAIQRWPEELTRAPISGEDCLALGDPASAPIALAATHLKAEGEFLHVDPALSFDAEWHGAAVVSRSDAKLVGLLLVEKRKGRISPAPFE
jgi:hypothetical protein